MKKDHYYDNLLQDVHFGTRILFENSFEKWRTTIGLLLGLSVTENFCSSVQSFNHSDVTFEPPSPASSSTSTMSNVTSDSSSHQSISLGEILNSSCRGKLLSELYTDKGKFDDEQRTFLINIIAS